MPGFQKQLGDIQTPVSTAAPSVSTTGAQNIQKLGELAGEAVKGFQKGRLEGEVQQTAQAASAVAGAVAEKGKGAFNEQGEVVTEGLSPDLQQQIDQVKATAGKKLGRIANAVRQGATTQAAAALETEATVRELVSQTPGFSQEIKGLARELVGFDPSGHALRQILKITTPKTPRKTAQSKRLEEARTMQDGLARAGKNVPLDTILGNMALRDSLKLEQETLDSQLDLNTLSIDQWAQQSFVERGPDLSGTMLKVVQMGAEGGIQDPTQYVNAVIQQREDHKIAFRQQVVAKGGMDQGRMQGIEAQIDAMYKPLIDSVNNNKMGDLLANKIDLIAKANQMWGKQATPRLTRIIDAYGPTIGGQLLEMMSNIADPKQFELVYQFDPALKELIQGGQETQVSVADGVEKVVTKVTSGEELTEEDMKYQKITEGLVSQPGNAEIREAFVKGLGNSGAPVRAVSLLTTKVPRANATPEEVAFMKSQFDVHVGVPGTEDVPGNLVDAIAREILELAPTGLGGGVKIDPVTTRSMRQTLMGLPGKETGQVKLSIPFDPTRQGTHLDFQTTSMKRLQPFMDAVTAKGYAGDLKVDKNTFPETIVARINNRIEKIKQAKVEMVEEPKPTTPEESLFTSIYNPSLVTGWALPENRKIFKDRPLPDFTKDQRPEGTPIGVWQNNPLNVKRPVKRDWKWDGEVDTTDPHAAFKDPAHGYRAAGMNLRIGFYRDGENTLTRIVKGPEDQPNKAWATGNQEPYIKFISERLGIDPNKEMSEAAFEKQLPLIMEAMTAFEQGVDNPFTEEDIEEGLTLLGDRGKVPGGKKE